MISIDVSTISSNLFLLFDEMLGARRTPCHFYAAGNCRNGSHCAFSHEESPMPSPRYQHEAPNQQMPVNGKQPTQPLSNPIIIDLPLGVPLFGVDVEVQWSLLINCYIWLSVLLLWILIPTQVRRIWNITQRALCGPSCACGWVVSPRLQRLHQAGWWEMMSTDIATLHFERHYWDYTDINQFAVESRTTFLIFFAT